MFYSLLPIPTEECAPSPFPNNISPYRASGIVMSLQLRTEQDVKNEDLGDRGIICSLKFPFDRDNNCKRNN